MIRKAEQAGRQMLENMRRTQMTKKEFAELTNGKILYLDGATGSNLYKAGMPRGVSTEQWVLEHPSVSSKASEGLCRGQVEASIR